MDPGRWQRICKTFEAARELRSAARDAVLAHMPDIADEVRELLIEHERERGPLQSAPEDPLVGRHIGPYRIERVLGEGGMATVYLASGPDGVVAIKRLQPLLAREPVLRERFRREADLGARIRHPNVVHTLGQVGEDCLVMERVEGETLQTILSERGHLAEAQCVEIACQLADALGAVHEAGAVHRDVKPANVIRRSDGHVKLMDLGIALPLDDLMRLSRTGEFIGTVRYCAPEHLSGGPVPVDGRADFYALGLLLYELASGSHPHPRAGLVGTMRAHLEAEPAALRTRAPEVSPPFEALVQRLLSKRPADRPQDVRALSDLLDGVRPA